MIKIQTKFPVKGFIDSRVGGRSENQDSCGFSETPLGFLITVCDGMGGMQGGSTASSLTVSTVIEYVKSAPQDADPVEVLIQAIRQANQVVIETGFKNPSLMGMGTTLTAVLINKDCAYCTYIGDSRIYQLRGAKKIFRTFDDSVVFQMVKSGLLTEEEARIAPNSNVILKAIGIVPDLEVSVSRHPYRKGDRFVLCSDGFWNTLPEKEFLTLIASKGDDMELMFERAFSKIELAGNKAKHGDYDNLTCAIFDTAINSKYRTRKEKTLIVIISVLVTFLLISLGLLVYSKSQTKLDQTEILKEQPDSLNAGNVLETQSPVAD